MPSSGLYQELIAVVKAGERICLSNQAFGLRAPSVSVAQLETLQNTGTKDEPIASRASALETIFEHSDRVDLIIDAVTYESKHRREIRMIGFWACLRLVCLIAAVGIGTYVFMEYAVSGLDLVYNDISLQGSSEQNAWFQFRPVFLTLFYTAIWLLIAMIVCILLRFDNWWTMFFFGNKYLDATAVSIAKRIAAEMVGKSLPVGKSISLATAAVGRDGVAGPHFCDDQRQEESASRARMMDGFSQSSRYHAQLAVSRLESMRGLIPSITTWIGIVVASVYALILFSSIASLLVNITSHELPR
ncbi:MAG: hypothetical protein AAFN77_16095 [Planctomycetota bacterium]